MSKNKKRAPNKLEKISNAKRQISKRNKTRKTKLENSNKVYDLEERTALFAERVRDFCLKLPKNAPNTEYIPQLIRAGSSPGANYIEANESIGDKDFKMKIKTCRRESKESAYWLRLVITDGSKEMEDERTALRQEAKEFVLIFTAILKKRGD
ncbi:MAG TPA: four helix bundle protein [Chitinophagaceae bacterium]|nr:four helix bundle protein [Chitinophagaceae bacterium]